MMPNKSFELLKIYSILFGIEVVVSFLLILIIENFDIQKSIDAVVLWNLWRVLFYGLPFLMILFISFIYIFPKKKLIPIYLSIFNLISYIILSYSAKMIWGDNIPLPPKGIMFWTTSFAILSAPFFLYLIPLKAISILKK